MRGETLRVVLVVLAGLAAVGARFSPAFRAFIRKNYGAEWEARLARDDFDDLGSWGGGESGETKNRPVIFMHGLGNWAGSYKIVADDYRKAGYAENELYSTSYGPARNPGSCHCEYVQLIRQFIIAVNEYTKRPVDIVAHSMGCVITRKAILGGECVESGEKVGTGKDAGQPITARVHTFIGLACPNYGAVACTYADYISWLYQPQVCNDVTGIATRSKFLEDIRKKTKYEGKHVFVLAIEPDNIVGNQFGKLEHQTNYIEYAEDTHIHRQPDSYNWKNHSVLAKVTTGKQLEFIGRANADDPKTASTSATGGAQRRRSTRRRRNTTARGQ